MGVENRAWGAYPPFSFILIYLCTRIFFYTYPPFILRVLLYSIYCLHVEVEFCTFSVISLFLRHSFRYCCDTHRSKICMRGGLRKLEYGQLDRILRIIFYDMFMYMYVSRLCQSVVGSPTASSWLNTFIYFISPVHFARTHMKLTILSTIGTEHPIKCRESARPLKLCSPIKQTILIYSTADRRRCHTLRSPMVPHFEIKRVVSVAQFSNRSSTERLTSK